MITFHDGKRFAEYKYPLEEELERDVVANAKLFFGDRTIFIDAKKKISTKALGGSIPDGFLFDLSDMDTPEFYLVEVELASHDFYRHIFPQITKFFGFFKSATGRAGLVEKLFSLIKDSEELKREFTKYLSGRELYKFLKDIVEDNQNILLLLDGEKPELPEIIETYTDTWGKMVQLLTLKKHVNGTRVIFSLNRDLESIEYGISEPGITAEQSPEKEYSEEFHLDGVDDLVKKTYYELKGALLRKNAKLIFNPKKYYISIVNGRNVAYFKIRRRKIQLVVMLPEADVRSALNSNSVRHLSDSVQQFWNGPSCEITIDGLKDLEEVIRLLGPLVGANAVAEK